MLNEIGMLLPWAAAFGAVVFVFGILIRSPVTSKMESFRSYSGTEWDPTPDEAQSLAIGKWVAIVGGSIFVATFAAAVVFGRFGLGWLN